MAHKLKPYVGPRPFEREDRSSFFGRDREARDLLSYVIAHEAVLLYAQSGAGKTSLLNAKLIPLLEEKGFEVLPTARVRGSIPSGIEPDQIPNVYVFNTLLSWAGGESQPEDLARMSLAQFLSAQEQPADEDGTASTRRVIIFDQFEELFSYYPERWDEREDFFRQVAEILTDPALRVLFVMREDYLANLAPYEKLLPERLRTRYRLERLRAEAALQAIEGPLQDTGYSFADGVAASLVQELLNIRIKSATDETVEVPGEYVEPVQLQVVCQNLWLNLPSDVQVITAEHLQSFGNVEEALRSFYERAIETAAKEASVSKDDLRKWFNEQLITPVGTRGTVFRGDEQTGDIPNSAVDALEDQHIIRAEVRSGARWYELTHDRLIEPIRKANEAWQEKEQERRIEEERQRVRSEEQAKRVEEQARTIKRLRILTAAMVVLFLAAIGASVFAFYQRKEAEEQARIAKDRFDLVKKIGQEVEVKLGDLTLNSVNTITLRAANGTYLKRYNGLPDRSGNPHNALVCHNVVLPDQFSYFILEVLDPANQTVRLIGDNGGYCKVYSSWVTKSEGHKDFISLDNATPDEWSDFRIEHIGGNRVTLQNVKSGLFLKYYDGYKNMSVIIADRLTPDRFSYFEVQKK